MFNFNALFCCIGGLAGLFITLKFSDSRTLVLAVAIASTMLIDLIMRLTNHEVSAPLFDPEAGGYIRIPGLGEFKFVPVWIICISLLILVGLMYFEVV